TAGATASMLATVPVRPAATIGDPLSARVRDLSRADGLPGLRIDPGEPPGIDRETDAGAWLDRRRRGGDDPRRLVEDGAREKEVGPHRLDDAHVERDRAVEGRGQCRVLAAEPHLDRARRDGAG